MVWEFWAPTKEKFKAKLRSVIKSGLDLFGFTVIEDKDKGIGVKTKDGKTFIPKATHDIIDHPLKVIEWFKTNMPDPKEDIYEEPPDEVIKGVHATGKMEKLPEYYSGEVLPAEQKGDIGALKSWIERVKWADMTEMDLRLEYNRHKGTTDLSPLTIKQRETLKDSIAFKIGRKLWYLGRRSAYETDGEFNRRTMHMRPAMGSYSATDTWTVEGGFPYDETYQYTSGELPNLEEKLKSGESVKW